MNEVTLPPAPNWYLSTALACARDGTIAWGAKACLIVGKRSSKDQKALNYTIIPNIHNDKLNSLSFSPDYGQSGKKLLVTGGNDATIKVWDLDKLEMLTSKSFESEEKVIGVDWSKSNPNMICAISTQGSLLTWQFTFKTSQIIPLGKITATCIFCSPHNPNLLAIGTRSGLIYIVNPQGKIIHKLRGHDHEIVSLSWCPTPLNIFKQDSPKEYLLASGAKDRTIFIWRPSTDGRYEAKVSLPSSPQDNTQHRTKLNTSPFTALLWLEPGILLANSAFGELLSLKLASIKRTTKPDWKIIHGNHSRAIFSITSYIETQTGEEIKPSDDENWRTEKEEIVSKDTEIWTTGQERQVICVVPSEENDTWRIEHNIPTLSGYIYCISPCPVDTSRIAFGVGDGMLRIWNLSEPHETSFDVISAWQDIKDRVTAIAWHPDKENLLAYGTSEGRVGVYDIFNISKRPVVFKMHHRKTIYRLEWGPTPPTTSHDRNPSTYSLFCCGDGELTCFNYDRPQQAPVIFIKKSCTEISWKPDYSCLAVGHDDGSISFLNRKLENCGKTIFLLKKPVECLIWHPDSTATDLNFSHFRNYLAASTTSPIITIFDMSPLTDKLNNDQKSEDTSQNFYKVVANPSGHSDRIYSLAWSPHISGYLASGSADKTVQVWKIEGQEIISTFTGHCNGVQAVMWSPLDHNYILSGSSDSSLRIWRFPDQKVVLPSAESMVLKSKIKKPNKKSTPAHQNDDKSNVNGIVDSLSGKCDENSKEISKTKEKDKKRGKKTVSYFPNYKKQINDKETVLKYCLELAQQVKGFESSHTIFGRKDIVSKILEAERDTHWEKEQSMMTVEMSLWDNKLKETITKAMETQSLSDFMVSLAPNLSMKFWREVCEAYSNQLVLEGNPMKAASYLLSLHKIREAIQILMQAKLYREAHAIAKCKLDPHDEMFKEINSEWLGALIRSGAFEEAALCSIASGDISEAVRILTRRKDALTLETAAKLAGMDKNEELRDSIVEEALNIQLSEFNYDKSRDLLRKFPSVGYRWIQVQAHEKIRKRVDDFETNFVENWLKGESSCGSIESLKKRFEEMETSKEEIGLFYKKLDAVSYPLDHSINQTESMLWLSISRGIALAAAAPDEEKKTRHVVEALGAISQYELLHPVRSGQGHTDLLIRVLSILEGVSPAVEESMFYFKEKEKEKVKGIYKSLRMYLCLGLLNWLLGRMNEIEGDRADIPVEFVAKFIQESLEFVLDRETVEYWMRSAEVTKLEGLLTSSVDEKKNEDGEEGKESQNGLLERLENVRQAQKKFVEEYVCAPSPMLVYSKANQLGSFIEDEEVKVSFKQTVADAWKRATNFPSEE